MHSFDRPLSFDRHLLDPSDTFIHRHIGPSDEDIRQMLGALGCASLDDLVQDTVPGTIRLTKPLDLGPPRGERETLARLHEIATKNRVLRSFIGQGYYDCITPPVIQRNILENPGWYTQYTPYQAEIAQGRLEALMTYQTMVTDLTGMPLANASLLDEATAAAEAMTMCRRISASESSEFFVAADCHPQVIAVVQTRARPLGIRVHVGPVDQAALAPGHYFGVLVAYPATDGRIRDYARFAEQAHAAGALVVVATDLLALTLLKPPGEFGADVVIGSAQRFGVPMGFGGPHAAFMATRTEFARQMPGRLIGISKDFHGAPAYRMAVQTREQHIRREKATSNICTAQVLLAIMAGMYAVYHGPQGLRRIAERVHALTAVLAAGLQRLGVQIEPEVYFDTLRVKLGKRGSERALRRAVKQSMNLRDYGDGSVGVSLDETTTRADVAALWTVLSGKQDVPFSISDVMPEAALHYPAGLARTSAYLTHPVFNEFHAEHELLRYLHRLQGRDVSLCHSMIPLGSCTMKLNATAEMIPISWPEFAGLHPYAPADQAAGYGELFQTLSAWLAEITGFAAVSLQPNSGAAGEYAGLLVIRAYHEARGQGQRDVCLIPVSAHGTNPASAIMAGCRVVAVACDERGNIDLGDLRVKAEANRNSLAALMVTYPSTHGVFEEGIREICEIVHAAGGQVYMDGANMNAQVGLCRPADMGADVCHLNLHKTFCIPHGGGGPGMGPIACAKHLALFLPGHPMMDGGWHAAEGESPAAPPGSGNGTLSSATTGEKVGAVAAAPWGSASILPISWMYIALMGEPGLRKASEVAILNANYMAQRLKGHYPLLYSGRNGRVAHEFIIDLREFQKTAHVTPDDVAKRLMDFGFHAPTMSWPVAGTLMVEPTESESKAELDRFCDALIAIREEIRAIEERRIDPENNPLKNAPHTAAAVMASDWDRPYPREQGAYPAPWVRERKFWPAVGRVDNVWGDRHLVCTCPPVESLEHEAPAERRIPDRVQGV